MPPISDPSVIRALLETDRRWSVYALGDLCPERFVHCQWFRAPGGQQALALLYRAFTPPVLLTLGDQASLRAVLPEIADFPEFYLHVRPEAAALLEEHYRIRNRAEMWRMILDPTLFTPPPPEQVARLGPADLEALEHLFADGDAAGERPGFFTASMLQEGVYFGVREGGELIAAAGTHLVAEAEGVAAIGNVYTRRDRRGRGLATHLVAAVAAELLGRRVQTIALNVSRENAPAIRVYERLGFRHYCDFVEGLAELQAHRTVVMQVPRNG
jgi:ribosomal protein S18 acetylase RimI-like enzyme